MEAAEMMKSEIGEDDIGESRGGRGRWREVGDCAGGGSRWEFRLSEPEEGRSGNGEGGGGGMQRGSWRGYRGDTAIRRWRPMAAATAAG